MMMMIHKLAKNSNIEHINTLKQSSNFDPMHICLDIPIGYISKYSKHCAAQQY